MPQRLDVLPGNGVIGPNGHGMEAGFLFQYRAALSTPPGRQVQDTRRIGPHHGLCVFYSRPRIEDLLRLGPFKDGGGMASNGGSACRAAVPAPASTRARRSLGPGYRRGLAPLGSAGYGPESRPALGLAWPVQATAPIPKWGLNSGRAGTDSTAMVCSTVNPRTRCCGLRRESYGSGGARSPLVRSRQLHVREHRFKHRLSNYRRREIAVWRQQSRRVAWGTSARPTEARLRAPLGIMAAWK